MQTNRLYIYRKNPESSGKLVLITDGAYRVDGRISNFWYFRYVNKNGRLGKRGGDYDNASHKFKRVAGYKVVTRIVKG